MTDRELLELIATQVGALTKDVSDFKKGQENLEKGQENLEKIVINIENDHGKKLDALFDGYKQNTEILNRIEKEVTRHEEFIIRKIK